MKFDFENGFSHSLNGLQLPESGYMVAVRTQHHDKYPTDDQVRSFIKANAVFFASDVYWLGGWKSPTTGKYCVEVSALIDDLGQAKYIGKALKQEAIYDLENKKDITL